MHWRNNLARADSLTRVAGTLALPMLWLAWAFAADAQTWSDTVDRVAGAVVAVQVDLTRPFEGQRPQSTQGTGFVVDAQAGLVLTNRHLVTAGPVVARALFVNGESVELQAVYRDPVHDFGFFRYDPEALRFLEVSELELAPGAARVGQEVRVVGNDAGERLSILAGTLSRLDRPAPSYQRLGYNDFNTFYYQAATGSSGGSSGSPVIDRAGRVLAMASGARSDAQTSFLLPLERIADALAELREGRIPARGSIATTFAPRAFFQLRELGLPPEVEQRVRNEHQEASGLLVVDRLLPGAPAADLLRLGDVLLAVDGMSVAGFVPLERRLDDRVGETVRLSVLRRGEPVEAIVPVADLHVMTPAAFVDFAGTTLHDLSYQLARNLELPQSGFQVTLPGFLLGGSGVDAGAVITAIDERAFGSVRALAEALQQVPDGSDLRIRYRHPDQPRQDRQAVVRVHREWFPERLCERGVVGPWLCTALDAAPLEKSPPQRTAGGFSLDPPVVHVEFAAPFGLAGYNELRAVTTGVVVDAARGWIAVDRDQVPHSLGEVRVVFGGRVEVPARVAHVHPVHALTVLAYPVDQVADMTVAEVPLATAQPGDPVVVVTSDADQQLSRREVTPVGRSPPRAGLFRHLRFVETNLEALVLPEGIGVEHGVVLDGAGALVGLLSGAIAIDGQRGVLPAELVAELLAEFRSGEPVLAVPAELERVPFSQAQRSGLGADLAGRLIAAGDGRSSLLRVVRPVAGTGPGGLAGGDLLLDAAGQAIGSFAALRARTVSPVIDLGILRGGKAQRLALRLERLDTAGLQRVVHWAGAMLHQPHRAARLAGASAQGVYVASYFYGSPAQRHQLAPLHLVTGIDGVPVATLDELVTAVARLQDRETTVIELESWNGARRVITLRTDLAHWPGFEIHRCGGRPRRSPLGAPPACLPE